MELTDIHDIKPLEQIGIDPALIRMAMYGLGAVALIVFLLSAFYWWKNRKRRAALHQPKPLPPHEAAEQMLDMLDNMPDISGQEFYFRLSAILRNYMDARFGIHAPEMTTEELVPRMDGLGVEKDMEKQLKEFLRYSDPIKFAAAETVESKMKHDIMLIRQFVNQTRSSSSPERNA